MATRATSVQPDLQGADENGPRKVSTKMIQGAILRRPVLGNLANRGKIGSIPVPSKTDLLKPSVAPKALKAKPVASKDKEENREKVKEELEVRVAKVEELSVAFSTHRLNVEDIDQDDAKNPQLVTTYVNDIYKNLRELEDKHPVRSNFLDGQVINGKMRTILIDWLVQVHHRFSLLQETLYLTVAIIDRYLQTVKTTPRDKLQLVGVTAMFIASKYEEMYCPEIADFCFITDRAYTKQEIRLMEIKMLKTLKFYVSYPLPLNFLRRNSKAGGVDVAQHTLAKYLMELTLPDYSMAHIKASLLASAVLCLSLKLLDGKEWTDTLIFYSRYTEKELQPVMSQIANIVIKSTSTKQQAIRQKYRGAKFMKISEIHQLKSYLIESLAKKCHP